MKHICIIGSSAKSFYLFRKSLIRDFVVDGWMVSCIAPDFDGSSKSRIGIDSVALYSIRYNPGSLNPIMDVSGIFCLFMLLNKIKPCTVISFGAKAVVYGSIVSSLCPVSRHFALIEGLGRGFGGFDESKPMRSAMTFFLKKFSYRVATSLSYGVFFLNSDDMDTFKVERMLEHNRAAVLGGIGVDLSYWAPSTDSVVLFRRPKKGEVTFLFSGRLLVEKGIIEYINVAYKVKNQWAGCRFVVLGDNNSVDCSPDVRKLIDLAVTDRVIEHFGFVDDVKYFLAEADVFVHPSFYREGVPRSCQEAMAFGLPIITSDTPGNREVVVDQVNGFFIAGKDVDSLFHAVIRFIEEPSLIESMGRESRRLAAEYFDERVFNALLIRYVNSGGSF